MMPLPMIVGGFPVILTDNPWRFRDRGSRLAPDQDRGEHVRHYRTMRVEELCDMGPEVRRIAAKDCLHFSWAPRTHIADGTAQQVARAWGFEPVTTHAWVKVAAPRRPPAWWLAGFAAELRATPSLQKTVRARCDMLLRWGRNPRLRIAGGHYTRSAHEEILICRLGHPKILSHREPSVTFAETLGHSRKPDEIQAMIERLAAGPYLEMFARRRRPGWYGWGDEYPQLLLPQHTRTWGETWMEDPLAPSMEEVAATVHLG